MDDFVLCMMIVLYVEQCEQVILSIVGYSMEDSSLSDAVSSACNDADFLQFLRVEHYTHHICWNVNEVEMYKSQVADICVAFTTYIPAPYEVSAQLLFQHLCCICVMDFCLLILLF